jgi:hypothetical protein
VEESKVTRTVSPNENPEPEAVALVVGGPDAGATDTVPASADPALKETSNNNEMASE